MSTEQQLKSQRLRVLVVEDNPDDALLVERHLRRAGFDLSLRRVETAGEMNSALLDSAGWDIVLADYHLPTFSAPEALDLLKSSGLDVPFVMMSGAVNEETAVAAMRAGAHDYIAKQNLSRLVPVIERELAETAGRRVKRDAERALRSSEERFHRLVQAIPLALLISDSSGRIIFANQGVESLLGYTQTEIETGAVTLNRIFSAPGSRESLLRRWARGNGEPLEIECRTSAGATMPVLVGAARLNRNSAPEQRQFVAFLADLTEQKHNEEIFQRTEKLAATGRLAASIAHEINNPLEAVTNCMYLMSQSQMDETARQYLQLAQRELNRVVHITTQTLRFYRQSTRPAETDIRELLETVVALYEARLRSNSITVLRGFREIPGITVFEGEVRQVLANLIGNAIDAMIPLSSGRLILRTAPARDWSTGCEGIAITVADTGSGMAPKTAQRIFEPFFSTKDNTGTGLGLWVSLEIIEKHHGVIRLRTRQQCGSVFRIFLPFRPAAVQSAEPPVLQASA
ncbi:MAG: ATP-binding protein [Acidobacteriaceae bacterium]